MSVPQTSLVLRKIISGGQTGADRAGLDFATEVGLEHGGFVPRGRMASFVVENSFQIGWKRHIGKT